MSRTIASRSISRFSIYEWLAAILIYHTTGYLSLISQAFYTKHTRKQPILCELIQDPQVFELITNSIEHYHAQCPDLLVYAPDRSDYFFCEVKGGKDRVRDVQKQFFSVLEKVSGKRVCYIKFALKKTP